MSLNRYFFIMAVTAGALSAAPQLRLSTTAVGPVTIAQGANGATQTVTASNIGTGTLAVTATASAGWLTASVSGGTSIQIALNTAALAPGSYTEFVAVNSPGAVDAPQNISVTVQIGGAPNNLTFYAAPGGPAVTQQITTQSKVNAAASAPWLSVSLSQQGSFTAFYPYTVTATPQAGQAAGDYTGNIVFSGGAVASDNKTTAVTLHLTALPILQFSPSALTLYSSGTTKTTAAVSVGNAGQGAISVTSAAGSAAWLSAAVNGDGSLTVTADPSGLAAGGYQGTITVQSNAANAAAAVLPVELIVLPGTGPQLNFSGAVDNATFAPTLAPGMISQVYGLQLAGAVNLASSLPLTTNQAGVQVSVNGIAAPVYYSSPNVVDFVVPWAVQPGPATVSLSYNGTASNTISVNVVARAPRILYFPLTVNGLPTFYGVAINSADGSLPIPVTPGYNGHPAKPGDTLTVYMLGLGQTTQNIADGVASPSSPLALTTDTPVVNLGGGFSGNATGIVQFSGLTPASTSLYQINVTLPPDSPIGDRVGLQVQFPGSTSNPVFIAISK